MPKYEGETALLTFYTISVLTSLAAHASCFQLPQKQYIRSQLPFQNLCFTESQPTILPVYAVYKCVNCNAVFPYALSCSLTFGNVKRIIRYVKSPAFLLLGDLCDGTAPFIITRRLDVTHDSGYYNDRQFTLSTRHS